jgi:hypothetical protein
MICRITLFGLYCNIVKYFEKFVNDGIVFGDVRISELIYSQ